MHGDKTFRPREYCHRVASTFISAFLNSVLMFNKPHALPQLHGSVLFQTQSNRYLAARSTFIYLTELSRLDGFFSRCSGQCRCACDVQCVCGRAGEVYIAVPSCSGAAHHAPPAPVGVYTALGAAAARWLLAAAAAVAPASPNRVAHGWPSCLSVCLPAVCCPTRRSDLRHTTQSPPTKHWPSLGPPAPPPPSSSATPAAS